MQARSAFDLEGSLFNDEEIFKLKKLIKELEKIKGRHTELVSVYIPAGYSISEITNQIFQEKGTASNIKSKSTRKNVLTALERILQHLRLFKQTPPNGLVVFCGNVSPVEGKDDIKLWSFEPPSKLMTKMYWCDQAFVLDPLKNFVKEREVYGLIVLDAKEANIGVLMGKSVQSLKHLESTVPSKTVKGGMCVAPDTLVSLENGTNIPIKNLRINDRIISFDFKKSKFVKSICNDIMKRKVDRAYEIVVDGTKILVTPEHLVFVNDGNSLEEKFAEDLQIGDELFILKNSSVAKSRIKQKDEIKCDDIFYDISIPVIQNFLANGIVVHNSQSRYDGIREDAINEFLTKVGEIASQVFLKQEDIKGVIVGGPGPVKERFVKGEYLHYELRKKLLGIKDVGETSEYGLQELVQRSEDLMMEASVVRERELLDKFFSELQKDGKVTYGFHEVKKALESGAVETLIISENFDWVSAKLKCSKCSSKVEKDLSRAKIEDEKCENCGEKMILEEDKEYMEILMDDAKKLGTKVEIVSEDSREGIQFKELGGIGAILRWKI